MLALVVKIGMEVRGGAEQAPDDSQRQSAKGREAAAITRFAGRGKLLKKGIQNQIDSTHQVINRRTRLRAPP